MNSSTKVLVVDDQTDNLVLMEMILEDDYDVSCVSSGQECLDKVQAICPDIIILDINMPLMDGYEVCRALKASPKTERIPVVFLSALDQEANKQEGEDAGGDGYINKPVDSEVLFTTINSVLGL